MLDGFAAAAARIQFENAVSVLLDFMIVLYAVRHDVPAAHMFPWIAAVAQTENPRFEGWTYMSAIRKTHIHGLVTKLCSYANAARSYYRMARDKARALGTTRTAQCDVVNSQCKGGNPPLSNSLLRGCTVAFLFQTLPPKVHSISIF